MLQWVVDILYWWTLTFETWDKIFFNWNESWWAVAYHILNLGIDCNRAGKIWIFKNIYEEIKIIVYFNISIDMDGWHHIYFSSLLSNNRCWGSVHQSQYIASIKLPVIYRMERLRNNYHRPWGWLNYKRSLYKWNNYHLHRKTISNLHIMLLICLIYTSRT